MITQTAEYALRAMTYVSLGEEISVLDVMPAMDAGVPRIEHCPLGIRGHKGLCPLPRLIDDTSAKIEAAFGSTTLADLSGRVKEMPSLCRVPGAVEAARP
ncbi:hypothetical protein BH09SUM1_BH09SUM1_00470 [soil metagenome]